MRRNVEKPNTKQGGSTSEPPKKSYKTKRECPRENISNGLGFLFYFLSQC